MKNLFGRILLVLAITGVLLVGSLDAPVVDLNRRAFDRLAARDKELVIVPGASHLFEERGKLEEVARLAAGWFERWSAAA